MSLVNSEERPSRRDLLINGPRPSPLKISKDSHAIKKPSAAMPKQQQRPVIIYTQSPKIIHTHARDFTALVQKLTGSSRSDSDNHEVLRTASSSTPQKINKAKDIWIAGNIQEDNESSSALTDKTSGNLAVASNGVNNVYSDCVPVTISPTNPLLADIPLFTPNSTDFFGSPTPVYKFADNNAIVSPTFGNLNRPSLLENL